MNLSWLFCHAFGIGAVVALLVGCNESQAMDPNTLPLSATSSSQPRPPGPSKAFLRASSGNLIYATGGCSGTCVLSYDTGNVVGTLSTGGNGICSDKDGNVFITNNNVVVEYSHGGSEPVATLNLPGYDAGGCSIDSVTGNLAVVFIGTNNDIAVFPNAQGTPTLYTSGLESLYCGYDATGDLFVSGYDGQQPGLSELGSGSSSFKTLSISGSVGTPGQVQWDGRFMAYEGVDRRSPRISRLIVSGSTARVVRTIYIRGINGTAYQSWIYGGRILVPYSNRGSAAKNANIWKYPKGGKPITALDFGSYRPDLHLQGITVSV